MRLGVRANPTEGFVGHQPWRPNRTHDEHAARATPSPSTIGDVGWTAWRARSFFAPLSAAAQITLRPSPARRQRRGWRGFRFAAALLISARSGEKFHASASPCVVLRTAVRRLCRQRDTDGLGMTRPPIRARGGIRDPESGPGTARPWPSAACVVKDPAHGSSDATDTPRQRTVAASSHRRIWRSHGTRSPTPAVWRPVAEALKRRAHVLAEDDGRRRRGAGPIDPVGRRLPRQASASPRSAAPSSIPGWDVTVESINGL